MKCTAFLLFLLYLVRSNCNYIEIQPYSYGQNYYQPYQMYPNWDYNYNQFPFNEPEKVNIKVYYEVFCPPCRHFDTEQLRPAIEKLGPNLDINTYPYGNAKTFVKNGLLDFECQHGPGECYGNKLHACALDIIGNKTTALIYNACMMEFSQSDKGSDDNAADRCGATMSINSLPIKQCAKGNRGSQLLQYYGEESKIANFKSVPHILINGVKNNGQNFMRDVCAAFANPPPACANVS